MKKIVALLLAALLITLSLASCAGQTDGGKRLRIVTTIFPIYDWIRNIVGDDDGVSIEMLIDGGVDFHNYQANTDDIIAIASCDLFVYVGGESDSWIKSLPAGKNDRTDINLMSALKEYLFEEEQVEGMETEDEDEGEEEEEFDEHIWLSLRLASEACKIISSAISEKDPENEIRYHSNTEAYLGNLSALDAEYESAVKSGVRKTLVFGDRFPFRYMTEDYGLDYYAAFAGCSAESEASFETVIFLAKKVDELGLNAIIKIEGSDGGIAETVKNNTKDKNATLLTLDSLQNVTAEKAQVASYISIMEANLASLKEALN